MGRKETEKPIGQLVGYVRVSTGEQKLDLQEDALKAAGCIRIFSEKVSGKSADRPELSKVLDYLREGDTLVVYKLDRLSRSTKDMLTIAEQLKSKGVNLKSLSDDIDTSTPYGAFFFTVCVAFGQLEREMILSRTRAGLDSARQRGRVGGRPPSITQEKAETARELLLNGKTPAEVCTLLHLAKSTMYRGIARYCPFEIQESKMSSF